MIEPVHAITAKTFVIGQESNRLKESRTKRGNSDMYLGFNMKLLFFFI